MPTTRERHTLGGTSRKPPAGVVNTRDASVRRKQHARINGRCAGDARVTRRGYSRGGVGRDPCGVRTYHHAFDLAPVLKGLPDDRCQCPHWGYVLKGRMVVTYGDREEIVNAGDAYYLPPGHSRPWMPGPSRSNSAPKQHTRRRWRSPCATSRPCSRHKQPQWPASIARPADCWSRDPPCRARVARPATSPRAISTLTANHLAIPVGAVFDRALLRVMIDAYIAHGRYCRRRRQCHRS